ncbi:MAG: hypothetical protein IPM51_11855 [Sphingobacteriaceae bacterium]|nr:hypothetical protein [Sphingobacteriaceae bacterium]
MLKEYGIAKSPFGFALSEDDARELDIFLETSEEDISYFRKTSTNFEHAILKERSDVSVITDNSVDHDKEVMDISSINWEIFTKNPHVAYRHNYDLPPVGKCKWFKRFSKIVKAKTLYKARPEGLAPDAFWFPDAIYEMVQKGYLPGKSIGGVAEKVAITKEYLDQHPEAAGAEVIRKNARIYEYSIVPVACNKNAVVETLAKGLKNIDDNLLKTLFPEVADAVIETRKSSELPVIKDWLSVAAYEENLSARLEIELGSIMDRVPEMIDKVLKRMLGQVS